MFKKNIVLLITSICLIVSCASTESIKQKEKMAATGEDLLHILNQEDANNKLLEYLNEKKQPSLRADFKATVKQNSIKYKFKGTYFYGDEIGEKVTGYDSFGRTLFSLIHNGKNFSAETPEETINGSLDHLSNEYFTAPLVKNLRSIIAEELPGGISKVILDREQDLYIAYLFVTEEDLMAIAWLRKSDGRLKKLVHFYNNEKVSVEYGGSNGSRSINITSSKGSMVLQGVKRVSPYDFTKKLIRSMEKIK